MVDSDLMKEKANIRKIFTKRFKDLMDEWEKSHPDKKDIQSRKKTTQKRIAEGMGVKQQDISNWRSEEKKDLPSAQHLLKISAFFGRPIDFFLGNEKDEKEGMAKKIPITLEAAIQTILDHIENPEILQSHGELFLLPILHLGDMGITQSQPPDRLILQEAICGRRKNVVPLRVNSEGKMNIFLFEKRKAREEGLP